MNSFYILLLPLGGILFWGYVAILIRTGLMLGRARNTTIRPNEFGPERIVFYPCAIDGKFKTSAMISLSGFIILLPCAIAAYVGFLFLDERVWMPIAITAAVGIVIMVLIGRLPFRYREACLIIDDLRVTVKYNDIGKNDKVYYISRYDRSLPETKYLAMRMVFRNFEGGIEELYLNFLRTNDAMTAVKMVEFIVQNGRMPVVQQVASAGQIPARQSAASRNTQPAASNALPEYKADEGKYRAYLEQVLAKIPIDERRKITELSRSTGKLEAIKECREFTHEGLRVAKDLVERYLS